MTVAFEALEGAQRVRPSEEQWAALVGAHADDAAMLPGALAPLTGAGSAPTRPFDAEVGHAAALLTGPARVRVEVRSRQESLGVLGLVACDGAICSAVVRRVDTSGGDLAPVPGVELSVFGVEALTGEVMRLLPPPAATTPDAAVTGPAEVDLPLEAALMLSRAVAEGDEDLALQVARLAGLEEVPPLVESLAAGLLGEVAVGTTAPATRFAALRSWLLCSLGWVALEPRGDRVVHRLVTTDDVRDDLVFDLTGAFSGDGHGDEHG